MRVSRSHREAPVIDGVVRVPHDLAVGSLHRVVVTSSTGPDLEAAGEVALAGAARGRDV